MTRWSVDLFAGCGGLSLGLEAAGFTPAYVCEINADALATYLINRHKTRLHEDCHANDIRKVTGTAKGMQRLEQTLADAHGIRTGELDLVCGGPPCQGFSQIGHRRTFDLEKKELPYNHLYKDMAAVIRALWPRAFLFENVGGLLSGKWEKDGENGEIWEDVLATFRALDYDVRWSLVRAKEYGVPQNRPRVLMIGIRNDIRADMDPAMPAGGFLPSPTHGAPDPVDVLGDLEDPEWEDKAAMNEYPCDAKCPEQDRLRDGLRAGDPLADHEYTQHPDRIKAKFRHMIEHGGEIPEEYRTRKFYQRVLPRKWGPRGPSLTVASNPADIVHYAEPRNLTVREYARMQTFPDSYTFTGKRQTGGRKRAGDPSKGQWDREVPKYTQIANAVPPRMGEAVGRHLLALIDGRRLGGRMRQEVLV